MGSLVKRTQEVERKKRYLALGVGGVSAALFAMTGWVLLPVAGVGVAAALGWDWWKFRAKHGMRF
jgi:hypothetical protein